MDIEALDQAMMDEMERASESGDPGPFWSYREDFKWSDCVEFAAEKVSLDEAAAQIVEQNRDLIAPVLSQRPRFEVVLGFLQRMAGELIAWADWNDRDAYNRMHAQRNAFVNSDRNLVRAQRLYFQCCTLAGVSSPIVEVWNVVYRSEEARLFCDALPRLRSHDVARLREIDPLALRIAVRLMGEWVAKPVDAPRPPPGEWTYEPPSDLECRATRRVDATIEWPELFRFALDVSEQDALLATQLALRVYTLGRAILTGMIDRNGVDRYPDTFRVSPFQQPVVTVVPAAAVTDRTDDILLDVDIDDVDDDLDHDLDEPVDPPVQSAAAAGFDLFGGNFAQEFPPLVPPWLRPRRSR